MDGPRFDTLTRSLTVAGTRRRALALVLSGAVGIVGLAHADDAAAGGKCKPKCGECKKCKKGKNGKKGKCKPKANGTTCSVGSCQGGRCVAPPFCADKPDFTDCGNGQKCSGGVCATPPEPCIVGPCAVVGLRCCSGGTCPAVGHFCPASSQGGACSTTSGCASGLTCVGFTCQ